MKIGEYSLDFLIQRTRERIVELEENINVCKAEVKHLVKSSIKTNKDVLSLLLSFYGYQ